MPLPSLSDVAQTRSLTDACLTRRCVHFCSELVDKVFVADEWDRSPAEVTPQIDLPVSHFLPVLRLFSSRVHRCDHLPVHFLGHSSLPSHAPFLS
jgi:hypothetical protein